MSTDTQAGKQLVYLDDPPTHSIRGRDWRRSQRDNHPDRRRRKLDVERGVTRKDKHSKPRRLLVEEARLACLITEGEA